MVTPHWPQPEEPSQPVGVGGIADFEGLISSDSNFAGAWGQVQAQLTLEGAGPSDITSAKEAFTDSFQQIASQAFGVAGQDAIDAAKSYVLTGKTIAGAVGTVQGLITAAESGAPLQIVQAFTGTLIGVAVAAGAVSAGVGAAIVGAVGALSAILQQAGFFGSPPAAGTVCGFPLYQKPTFTLGCMGAWAPVIAVNSAAWRPFPDPTNSTDAAWFQTGHVGPGQWRDGFYGIRAPGKDQSYGGDAPNPASNSDRPIDIAFPGYSYCVEAASGKIPVPTPPGTPVPSINTDFARAFIPAWKANAVYSLNGLKPQPDWQVLVHLLRMWNKSHDGSSYEVLLPPQPNPGYNPNDWTSSPMYNPSFFTRFVEEAIMALPASDPIFARLPDGRTGLRRNVGAQHQPPISPRVIHLRIPAVDKATATAPGSTSTAVKVAAGGAAVTGAALVGVVAFSLVKGKAVDVVLGQAWKTMKGWFRK